MLQVVAEQKHHLLISDGQHFTVVERRAVKFYPLCKGVRHGLDLDEETVPELIRRSGSYSELDAECRLAGCCFSVARSVRAHPMKQMRRPVKSTHPWISTR